LGCIIRAFEIVKVSASLCPLPIDLVSVVSLLPKVSASLCLSIWSLWSAFGPKSQPHFAYRFGLCGQPSAQRFSLALPIDLVSVVSLLPKVSASLCLYIWSLCPAFGPKSQPRFAYRFGLCGQPSAQSLSLTLPIDLVSVVSLLPKVSASLSPAT